MCGRYTLIRLADFTDMFPWIRGPSAEAPPSETEAARYNIAPTQPVATIPNDGKNEIKFFHWGLIPSWAKDPSIGNRMINARLETLAEKPAFRTALKRRRCLILASGFYEWKKNPDGKTKTPMYIRMKDGRPFAFAGLWETWHSDDGSEIRSCTIITQPANDLMGPIHERMPVILAPENYKEWLEPAQKEPPELMNILNPYPSDPMQAYAVRAIVNNPRNDLPECIEAV